MDGLMRITRFLNMLLLGIAGFCLAGMILLTCGNILFRQIYVPIPGTFELMGYAGAIATAFALGYTQSSNSHISVDILVDAYPKPMKRAITMINHSVCCVFFALAAWFIVKKALNLKTTGEISETLRIIYYPFTLAVALGCFGLALTLLAGLFKAVFPDKDGAA